MKIKLLSVLVSGLFLAACVSNPSTSTSAADSYEDFYYKTTSLQNINYAESKQFQDSKPAVFKTAQSSKCSLLPITATNLSGTTYYKDKSSSVVDTELKAKNDMELFSYFSYIESLNKLSTSYMQNKDKSAGRCVISNIVSMARSDALLGHHNHMGRYVRVWMLSGFAANYLKVRNLATSDQDELIKWWMTQVTIAVKDFWDHPIGDVIFNNHYAYAGVAVMQVGMITGDQASIEWGRKVFNQQVNTVTAAGYLPQELDRKKQASRYHNFTLQPLVYMAVLSKQFDEDWMQNEKLQRLITFTANANINVDIISKLVGEPAVTADTYSGWMALLPDSDPRRTKAKIYGFPDVGFLGGNQELMRNLLSK